MNRTQRLAGRVGALVDRHPLVALLVVVALLVAAHYAGAWGWYLGGVNGGLTFGQSGGVELYGHPGFFVGQG